MKIKHLIYNKAYLSLFFLYLTTSAFAQTSLDSFYISFRNGQYKKALDELNQIQFDEKDLSTRAYLMAISHSRLQEYDLALKQFALASELKNENSDLYYEYGQALYAANEIKKAREAFKISVAKKNNVSTSIYYIAHISQILEEFEMARDSYVNLLKDKNLDPKLKQISRFQLGETLLSIARVNSKNNEELTRRVEKFILPIMDTAFSIDKSTEISKDIQSRRAEIVNEFKLDPNLLVNGRRISPKRYNLYLSQKVKFDDNISLTNEENNTQQSKKESFIFETEAFAKYDFVLKKKFTISPEARITFTEHADQTSPDVYQNDALVINANLKNRLEYSFRNRPASLLFDVDTSQISKDWNQQKKREAYASSMTLGFGSMVNLFEIGETTFKIKLKDYTGKNTDISNKTTSFNIDQTFYLQNQHLLVGFFDASFIDNFNSPTTSTDTYLIRFDYIIPEVLPDYTFNLAFATTMTDTKLQKETRGTEMAYNPSIYVTRALGLNSKIIINYDFSKTKSNEASYSYNKSILSFEFRYSF